MTATPSAHPYTARVRLDDHSAVRVAARSARVLAQRCQLPGPLPDQAATVASELGSNLVEHARDGVLFLQPLPLGDGMEILAADRGPGMADRPRRPPEDSRATGGPDTGLGVVGRLAADFQLRTHPGVGTLATARLAPPERARTVSPGIGSLCLPIENEVECGDACAVTEHASARTAVLVDGLGHGAPAAEAARRALDSYHRDPTRPVTELVRAMHRALLGTRGAAVAVLRLSDQGAEYCGVGNVHALLQTYQGVQCRLRCQPGVVGWNLPSPRAQRVPVPEGATAVLHSDGIDGRWSLDPHHFLLRLPPALLAASLVHGHRRVRDDASVVAVRPGKAAT